MLIGQPFVIQAQKVQDRYAFRWNVGLSVGMTWASQLRFTYGADVRFGRGPAVSFARVEGYGTQNGRLSGGFNWLPRDGRASSGSPTRGRRGAAPGWALSSERLAESEERRRLAHHAARTGTFEMNVQTIQ